MKLLFTSLLCMFFSFAKADPQNFTGKKKVAPGSTETYTITWNNWGGVYQNYANVYWSVPYGTVISQNKNEVTIEWDWVPTWMNVTSYIEVTEDLGGQQGSYDVDIVNFIDGTSQTCGGVLGPAAVFQNFGAGPNPGPALPGGLITYQYKAECAAVKSGFYTVTNRTTGCNGSWLNLVEDHTPGDVNGYMLLVDGDDNAGEVYRTTASNLTQSFSYEFSAYIANLAPYPAFERPRVKFEIYNLNGILLGTSGSIQIEYDPVDPWKRLSFVFDIPLGLSSVQIVLKNDNGDPLGNDFVVDDLTFAPCYPPIIASFSNTTIVDKTYTCNNGTVNLFSKWPTTTIPFTNPRFIWQKNVNGSSVWTNISGASISPNFSATESIGGVYKYRVLAYEATSPGSQLLISNEITYFVQKLVVDAKTYNVFGCNTAPFKLVPSYRVQYTDPDAPVSFTYSWTPGTYLNSTTIEQPTMTLPPLPPPPAINSPTAAAPIIRIYNLTVQNTSYVGCIATVLQTVAQYNPRKVAIPNVFTPAASTNKLFRPINIQDYPGAEFWIYNRWGQLVFYSNGPTLLNYSWNGYVRGELGEQGVYTWKVNIPGCPNNILNGVGNGVTTSDPFGTVTLIR